MSYCVNCGVELRESEERCPLCGTVVLNPNRPDELLNADPAYPRQSEFIDLSRKKRLTFLLFSVTLALPAAVCMAVNFMVNGGFTWSYYVLGSVAVFWVLFVLPFFLPRRSEFVCLVLDYLVINGFLYGIQMFTDMGKEWYVPLGAPLVGTLAAGVLLGMLFLKSRPSKFTSAAVLTALAGLESVSFEMITDRYLNQTISLGWSVVTLVACLFLSAIFLLIGRKRRWKESIKKRIHI